MRRFSLPLSIFVVLLLGVVAIVAQPRAFAQEASPEAGEVMPEDISYEPVTFALGADLASPADLFVVRIGLEPGAGFPIDASDPTVGVLLVENGTITVEVQGPVTVTRGEGLMEAIGAAETTEDMSGVLETIALGEVVKLEAGDAAYIPGNVNGEIRNEERVRAEGLAFLVGPPEAMMTEAATPEATPAP
jgi:quercetin dioxygenase-like cupin family protein